MPTVTLLKFTNFCYHGNKGRSGRRLNDKVKYADPQTPSLVQEYGTYLKYEPSYGKFGVKISKFSLLWQQGLV